MNDGHERNRAGAEQPGSGQLSYDDMQAAYSQHFEQMKHSMQSVQEDVALQNALKERAQHLGLTMPGAIDISALTGELCKDWPKVKGFLGFALSLAVFWPGAGAIAAGAKALIAMVDTQLIPSICPRP